MTDYRFHKPIKRSNAERRTFNGIVYDSILEMQRAAELETLRKAGEIVAWFRQVPVSLGLDTVTRVDFLIVGTNRVWCEEVKGFDTREFRRIMRLWKEYGPLPLLVLRRGTSGWCIETIDAGYAPGTV